MEEKMENSRMARDRRNWTVKVNRSVEKVTGHKSTARIVNCRDKPHFKRKPVLIKAKLSIVLYGEKYWCSNFGERRPSSVVFEAKAKPFRGKLNKGANEVRPRSWRSFNCFEERDYSTKGESNRCFQKVL